MTPEQPALVALPKSISKVLLAGNRGPCGGVNMAFVAASEVLDLVDGREAVYTNRSIVHNTPVMKDLEERGLINIQNDFDKLPQSAIVFLSAHGISPHVRTLLDQKNALVVDTTCVLVEKVHKKVVKAQAENQHVVYIGARNHPEPIGVLGELEEENYTFLDIDEQNAAYEIALPKEKETVVYSQTTLSTAEVKDAQDTLKRRFPDIHIPDRSSICYATDNRQQAVDDLILKSDFLLVVGSPASHNSTELKEIGEEIMPSVLIDTPEEIDTTWFRPGMRTIGITSGASVLEKYTKRVLDWFRNQNIPVVELPQSVPEKSTTFVLPKQAILAIKERYD